MADMLPNGNYEVRNDTYREIESTLDNVYEFLTLIEEKLDYFPEEVADEIEEKINFLKSDVSCL